MAFELQGLKNKTFTMSEDRVGHSRDALRVFAFAHWPDGLGGMTDDPC